FVDLINAPAAVTDQLLRYKQRDRNRHGARRSDRDERVADRERAQPNENRWPDPDPPTRSLGEDRTDERGGATRSGDDPDRGRPEPQLLGREDQVHGAVGAPQQVGGRARRGERAQDRRTKDRSQAVPDL